MTHKFVMELEDNCKGYKEEVERLERMYGIEPIDEHDKQVRADALDEYVKLFEKNALIDESRTWTEYARKVAEQLKEQKC